MIYRKEIDGLRAIAVIPVILFHGGFAGFDGGYVGVDIFFVISGYLITSLILEEKCQDSFSIINFYERRARRILPALGVVLFITTLAAYAILNPWLLKQYSQSLVAVTTFSSNIFFFLKSGYFAAAADELPLLHTWSLAVEEQYYLFFPILIVFLWRFGQKWIIGTIVFTAAISLLFAQYLFSIQSTDANFYLIFSRAWELFLGSAIVFIPRRNLKFSLWWKNSVSVFGLLMIVYSIISFNRNTPFPSGYTLIPVVGTCLVIIFSDGVTLIGRLLSLKAFVFIGLISYSLYLWHHAIFAFLRLTSIGEPTTYAFLVAIFFSFVLAFLSWKYIETPFRNKQKFSQKTIFKLTGVLIAAFFAIGLAGHFNEGYAQRFEPSVYSDSIQYSPKRQACHTCCRNYLPPVKACQYFGKNTSWAVFGDSHMVEPAYTLAKRLEPYDIGIVHLSFSGCPPALLFDLKKYYCTNWIKESLDYLKNNNAIKHVLLGFRYSKFLFGDQIDAYPNLPDIDPSYRLTDEFNESSTDDTREIYWRSFQEIITSLLQAGKVVHILYPIPELPIGVDKAIRPLSVFGEKPLLDLQRATTATYYLKRNEFILHRLDSLPYGENLHAVKPFDILCNDEYCPAVWGDKALYWDDNHLSLTGAALVTADISLQIDAGKPE
jgi:peptidoglycan/LPS O-acetylase OafA/YrhL